MSGVTYALAQWFLSLLPVDDGGKRVFDETLADWRREAAKAAGPAGQLLVCARAMFAVFRSIAGVSLREITQVHHSGLLTRVFLWTAGYLVVMTLISQRSAAVQQFSAVSRAYLGVSAVAFFFPAALLLASGFGASRRPLPAMGAALMAMVIGAPLLGWALPTANRRFMDANPWSYVTDSGATVVVPYKPGEGLMMSTMSEWQVTVPVSPSNSFRNDLTITQLGARVLAGPEKDGWSAIRWLSFFGAYVATCVLAPIVASVSRRLSRGVRFTLVITSAALLFVQPWRDVSLAEFSVAWWLGAFWVPVAWLSLCVVAAHRVRTNATVPLRS